ncbi:hypothetical protein A2704_01510 [Candidatus Kaiserbacteria bacterium RIFCSPHIGHO2_01_FULL_54_36b]|uniref:Uncharacterized protein n=2 Tax=Parcubacteria group TaxID=1794811 RepID=A0A1F6CQL2_9BACT|nr:MAG: hypothetical protein A2704_01510 [Candidatus Kaiserbacteria bacterium RIFCSPHIGHO2_01_FULL_54_36b]
MAEKVPANPLPSLVLTGITTGTFAEATRMATETQERMKPLFESMLASQRRLDEAMAPATSALEGIMKEGSRVSEAFASLGKITLPHIEGVSRMRELLGEIGKPVELPPGLFAETREMYFMPRDPYVRIHPASQEEIVEAVVTRISVTRVTRGRAEYILPENAAWEKLRVHFVDGHTVRVKYHGMSTETFDYKDMGFLDRKTNNPDKKWEFLRSMADEGGVWPVEKFRKNYHRTAKYQVSQRLKRFFSVGTDPFEPYARGEGYRIRFVLKSDTDPHDFDD